MPVSILTDSAASLPKEITTAAAISVVPMWLTIGETSMHDGDLSLEEVMARIDEGITTSAPTPGEFEVALEEVGVADGALVLTDRGHHEQHGAVGTRGGAIARSRPRARARHRNRRGCGRARRARGCGRCRAGTHVGGSRGRGTAGRVRVSTSWRPSRTSTVWPRAVVSLMPRRGRDGGWGYSRCSSSATVARTPSGRPAAAPKRSTGSTRVGYGPPPAGHRTPRLRAMSPRSTRCHPTPPRVCSIACRTRPRSRHRSSVRSVR